MPDADINEVIAEVTKEYGLSDEGQKTVQETNSMLDAFHEKADELRAAKENDISTQRWLGKQVDAIMEKAEGGEEEKAKVADAMIETINKRLNAEMTED